MFTGFLQLIFSNPLWMGLIGGVFALALYLLTAFGIIK